MQSESVEVEARPSRLRLMAEVAADSSQSATITMLMFAVVFCLVAEVATATGVSPIPVSIAGLCAGPVEAGRTATSRARPG
jgi:hypothetical protein